MEPKGEPTKAEIDREEKEIALLELQISQLEDAAVTKKQEQGGQRIKYKSRTGWKTR